jgi:hypothetical protein
MDTARKDVEVEDTLGRERLRIEPVALWRNLKLELRRVLLRRRSRAPCHLCKRTERDARVLIDIGRIALCDGCIGRAHSLVVGRGIRAE